MKKLLTILSVGCLTACASHTDKIAASYVSPLEYKDFSCKQISAEMARVTRHAQETASSVNKNADGDSTAMGVGLVLFWPALFFIDGNSPEAQEYARLKGEFDALEQAAIQKNCKIKVEQSPFEKIEADRRAKQQEMQKQQQQNNNH